MENIPEHNKLSLMDKKKITITRTNIKGQFLNNPLFSMAIPIALSVWILSLTAYHCINAPWLSFLSSGWPDTKELIAETLKFHWVPVFLSRLPYVFYALILNFIALLVGSRILRWLKADFDSLLNKIIFSIPLGWSIYSIGIFWLGISGLLYKEAVYCFLTLLGILSILEIKRFFKPPHPNPLPLGERIEVRGSCHCESDSSGRSNLIDKTDPESSSGQALIFLPVIIIFTAIPLVASFSPIVHGDYHMALPKLNIKHHALVYIPGCLYSTLPGHTDMLYLLGLITWGETISRLFSFSISVIFLISIFFIGNRYFSKRTGYLAAIIMMTMQSVPPFSPHYSEPSADVSLGLFSLLGVYAFFMWIEERNDGYLYLSIINCAFAAANKINGLFFVLLFFMGFLFTVRMDRHSLRQSSGQAPKKLMWCFLVVGIIALPWYIRSWLLTGDPFFPLLYNYIGAKNWSKYSNECLGALFAHGAKSFSDFIMINKDLFSLEKITIYSLSPIIVIFLIPVLITLKNWNKLIIHLFLIVLVYYIFFIFTSPQMRYFFVASAILSIIVAHFIKTIWTKYMLIRIPIILCITALSIVSFSITVKCLERPFFTGLGVLDQKRFLNDFFHYKVAIWVNENLPQNSKILSWAWQADYHLDRDHIGINPAFQSVLDFSRINDVQFFFKSIKELGITHLLYYDFAFTHDSHLKEFLDKCVSELLESGKITLVKQIESCAIYSIME